MRHTPCTVIKPCTPYPSFLNCIKTLYHTTIDNFTAVEDPWVEMSCLSESFIMT